MSWSESLALIRRTDGYRGLAEIHLLDGNGGQCVEVASDDIVMVRDTTNRDGGTLAFSVAAWERFLGTIR